MLMLIIVPFPCSTRVYFAGLLTIRTASNHLTLTTVLECVLMNWMISAYGLLYADNKVKLEDFKDGLIKINE